MGNSEVRKSIENPETYEAILDRSRARFPNVTLPDIVDFNRKNENDTLEPQLFTSAESDDIMEKKITIPFDELYARAVERGFVSAEEMKFLILVDKFFVRRKVTKLHGHQINLIIKLNVSGFTYVYYTVRSQKSGNFFVLDFCQFFDSKSTAVGPVEQCRLLFTKFTDFRCKIMSRFLAPYCTLTLRFKKLVNH